MKVEWKLKTALSLAKLGGVKPYHQLTPEEARRQDVLSHNFVKTLILGRVIPLPRIENIVMTGRAGDIPARVYWPHTDCQLPILVYYHGGGFVTGSLDTHDNICRRLARDAGRLVFSIDYRLAPEHPFPAGLNDCFDALMWIAEHAPDYGGDVAALAIGGDSAGGNLAAVVCQLVRDQKKIAIQKQLLIYPAVDASKKYPSELELADAPILSEKDVKAFRNYYLNREEDAFDPCCSPLLGRLEQLPETFIVTAELDPLRDQGAAYAAALAQHGVTVHLQQYARQVHGFISFPALAGQAPRAFLDMVTFLKWD